DSIRQYVARETEKRRLAIRDLFAGLAKLQSTRNFLAPINALPAELLNMAFRDLRSPSVSSSLALDTPFRRS
ncbi:hypothetical protein BD311DRAFT_661959, partial [Dichomitus squalens]